LNGSNSAEIDTDELKQKTIGLFFSWVWPIFNANSVWNDN
jgi:hypothetical protein